MRRAGRLYSSTMSEGDSSNADVGRKAAFEQLVTPLLPALARAARRLARPPQDAADLVQETLLRAYRTFENFQAGTNAKAWLFTILYSIAANVADKERRHPTVHLDNIEERFARAIDGRQDTEQALLAQLDRTRVDAAVSQLPADFRDAVLLVDLEELTYEEAAAVLKCPIGTVRSRLFRGRKLLFLALRDYALSAGLLTDR
jgi:RNA polymerase sigma-70 factor (ECF subfamily)